MTCRSFRKYVGAFADGELDTQTSAGALEHLNMCPACAARVTEVQRMKEALRRVLGQEKAPPELASMVRASIRSQRRINQAPMGRIIRTLVVPLGIAAALLLAVTVWQFRETSSRVQVPIGAKTVVGAQTASQVRNQHTLCSVLGPRHHDQSLGRDLPGIARELTKRLKMQVIAPDLSGQGFVLLGADRCGMMGRPGSHVLYKNQDGHLLSVFSVVLAECGQISLGHVRLEAGRQYAVDHREKLSLVGWTEGCVTYLLCGDVSPDELLHMAASVRGPAQSAP